MSKYVIPFQNNSNWKTNANCPFCLAINDLYNEIMYMNADSDENQQLQQSKIQQLENLLVDGYGLLQVYEKNGYFIYNKNEIDKIKYYTTNSNSFMSKVSNYFDPQRSVSSSTNIDDPVLLHSRWCKNCGSRKPDIYDPLRDEIPSLIEVINFNVEFDDNTGIKISWQDPDLSNWSKTKLIRKNNSKPSSDTDGVVITEYSDNSSKYKDTPFIDQSFDYGNIYYYVVFEYDDLGNVITASKPSILFLNATDFESPAPIMDLSTKHIRQLKYINSIPVSLNYVKANWTEPIDGDLDGVVVRFDELGPSSPEDGFQYLGDKVLVNFKVDWSKVNEDNLFKLLFVIGDSLSDGLNYKFNGLFENVIRSTIPDVLVSFFNYTIHDKFRTTFAQYITGDIGKGLSGMLIDNLGTSIYNDFQDILITSIMNELCNTVKLIPNLTESDYNHFTNDLFNILSEVVPNVLSDLQVLIESTIVNTINAMLSNPSDTTLINFIESIANVNSKLLLPQLNQLKYSELVDIIAGNSSIYLLDKLATMLTNASIDDIDNLMSVLMNILSDALLNALSNYLINKVITPLGTSLYNQLVLTTPENIANIIVPNFDLLLQRCFVTINANLQNPSNNVFTGMNNMAKIYLVEIVQKILLIILKDNAHDIKYLAPIAHIIKTLDLLTNNLLQRDDSYYFKAFTYDKLKIQLVDNDYFAYRNYSYSGNISHVVVSSKY